MSDHMEEQEMEAEALTAIFDTAFEITSREQPFQWAVSLYPVDASDEDERDELNHVGCRLKVELPIDYPDVLPSIDIEVIKVSFVCFQLEHTVSNAYFHVLPSPSFRRDYQGKIEKRY